MTEIGKAECDWWFDRIVAANNLWEEVAWKAAPDDRVVQYAAQRLGNPAVSEGELEVTINMVHSRLLDYYKLPEEKHIEVIDLAKEALTQTAQARKGTAWPPSAITTKF